MERMDARVLEELLSPSTPVHRPNAGKVDPRPRVISADYLNRHTVEPSDAAVADGYRYIVKIAKSSDKRTLTLMLEEREEEHNTFSTRVFIGMRKPFREDMSWVNDAAWMLAASYKKTATTGQSDISCDMLRRLIATRVEYYMRGGSVQRMDN